MLFLYYHAQMKDFIILTTNVLSMKVFLFLSALLCMCVVAYAQEYRKMMFSGKHTMQEIQAEANGYFEKVGKGKGTGYKQYKRWEYQALRRRDKDGYLPSATAYIRALEAYNATMNVNGNARSTTSGTWQQLGPFAKNATTGWNPGVGRITSMAVDPSNQNHIIVGGETGGVWRTTDGGSTWAVLTDNLPNLLVASLAMHPGNTATYYWGAEGTIFKSTDSGATWNTLASVSGLVNKILIDPNNTNKMYCSIESGGLFKSTDGGATWNRIHNSAMNGYDIEFKPNNSNVIYATGDNFFKSVDGGNAFTLLNPAQVFSTGPKMIGVSAANPDKVYVIEAVGSIFGGFYVSNDSGSTFTKLNHGNTNYFGYDSQGMDSDGQAPRDMDIAVNPANADEVHIAGINTWRSTNGGTSFTITSQWTPDDAQNSNIGYCHADVDILEFVGNKLYVGSDGGFFVANNVGTVNASYYTDLSQGLGIRQFYRIGISQSNPVVVTGGSQDNGTSVYDNTGTWKDWLGADGMEGFVDKTNNNILYGTTQNGGLNRSDDAGATFVDLGSPDNKQGAWVTPFEQDPTAINTIYVGYDQVYKSTDQGGSWNAISQNFGLTVDHLKIAPSNNTTMLAVVNGALYKTTTGSGTWASVTLPAHVYGINSIAIHPTNPNRIALAVLSSTEKVIVSQDGGTTWSALSAGLPNISPMTIVWHDNGNDGLYLGMQSGVYYRDNQTGANWLPFNNNLPNVQISELEINTVEGKLYAGTYGRGLWRSDLYANALSIKNLDLKSIALYPNPANKQLTIQWDKAEKVTIKIYDATGKLVYYTKDQDILNSHVVNVESYETGVYFVKINHEKGAVLKKVVVN